MTRVFQSGPFQFAFASATTPVQCLTCLSCLCQVFAQQLGLLKNGLGGLDLLVRRVVIFAEDPLDVDTQLSLHAVLGSPVDGDILAQRLH